MKKKILYVVNIDSFFISHREDIALKAKSFLKLSGYKVQEKCKLF